MLGALSGSEFSGTDVGASARSQPSGRLGGWETRTLSQGPRIIARVCGGWRVGVTLSPRLGLRVTLSYLVALSAGHFRHSTLGRGSPPYPSEASSKHPRALTV